MCYLRCNFRGRERLRIARQLGDHSTFLAPYNVLMYAGSGVPNEPVVSVDRFPELAKLRDNWETIRDEAVKLFDEGFIPGSSKEQTTGVSIRSSRAAGSGFTSNGTMTFFHRLAPSARRRSSSWNSIPTVHGAMFTMLPAGGKLGAHRDPFAGSLRYHLGLVTPPIRKNAVSWSMAWNASGATGQAFMFDETFIHRAENATDVNRDHPVSATSNVP